ncbi:hypothetical protein, partial [Kaarinaea lacus]
ESLKDKKFYLPGGRCMTNITVRVGDDMPVQFACRDSPVMTIHRNCRCGEVTMINNTTGISTASRASSREGG